MAKAPAYPPEFEAEYQPELCDANGRAYKPTEREARKAEAFAAWSLENQEPPIASPDDSDEVKFGKIKSCVLAAMTESQAVKHAGLFLKHEADMRVQERRVKVEKLEQAPIFALMASLYASIAAGQVPKGPGWVQDITPLSPHEQAEIGVTAAEAVESQGAP